MYTSLLPGWTHFCLHSCFSSTWHRFNAAQEILVRDFSPFSPDIITQLLHNCLLHIHDGNLLLLHLPKVLYWLKIRWLWKSFVCRDLTVMFRKPVLKKKSCTALGHRQSDRMDVKFCSLHSEYYNRNQDSSDRVVLIFCCPLLYRLCCAYV